MRLAERLGAATTRPRRPDPPVVGEVAREARRVTVEVGDGRAILRGASVVVRGGEVVALVGPNGAGKSTLVGVLSGDVEPVAGEVVVDGVPLSDWTGAELALRRSVLPQQVGVTFPFTVREVVEMGRAPWVALDGDHDGDAVVDASLAGTDVAHLADRTFPSLSGGERSRAALARVLAQDAGVLLLDEPTAALDLHHQEMVLRLARERATVGVAVVVVLHDLGLAAAHADRIVVLDGGEVVVDGSARRGAPAHPALRGLPPPGRGAAHRTPASSSSSRCAPTSPDEGRPALRSAAAGDAQGVAVLVVAVAEGPQHELLGDGGGRREVVVRPDGAAPADAGVDHAGGGVEVVPGEVAVVAAGHEDRPERVVERLHVVEDLPVGLVRHQVTQRRAGRQVVVGEVVELLADVHLDLVTGLSTSRSASRRPPT